MIKISHRGKFKKTEGFLTKAQRLDVLRVLNRYGPEGVRALANATPIDSGLTADSWFYVAEVKNNGRYKISWCNRNEKDGVPIAILIQYGHATLGGNFVKGRDFINPAIKPIFDEITETIWKEVTSL